MLGNWEEYMVQCDHNDFENVPSGRTPKFSIIVNEKEGFSYWACPESLVSVY